MEVQELLNFIHGIPRFSKNLSLSRMEQFLTRLGNPEQKLAFVHVAGTNGKGSTCTMLSYVLAEAGYTTGLYISPYVLDFRERIQCNNEMIPPDNLVSLGALVQKEWYAMEELGNPPSEFEVVVAIALLYFVEKNCDIVVLEVGLGGRWDATNVISTPLVSVITSISMDHTQYLGDTLEKIAYEKAGIIKPNGVTVSYPKQEPEVLAVLMEECARQNNPLYLPVKAEILKEDICGSDIVYDGEEYHVPLAGEHQIYNTLTVLETCKLLQKKGFSLSKDQIYQGMKQTKFPSRLEILGKRPLILLDGAHNLSGAQALVQALSLLEGKSIHAVIGMMKDKDTESVAHEIAPHCTSIIATQEEGNSRFLSPEKLAEYLERDCSQVEWNTSPDQALHLAYERCTADDVLLICGSLYLASVLRSEAIHLGEEESPWKNSFLSD